MGDRRGWPGGRGGRPMGLALAVAALVTAGACAAGAAPADAVAAGTQTAVREAAAARPVDAAAAPREGAADAADPVRLRIPAIRVSAKVIPLRLDRNGRLIAPQSFVHVGWNKAGPEPGEPGVAAIAGHVDSRSGPAVFFRLRQLRPGNRVHVDRADGSTVTFTVTRVARYPKNRIPNREVYGPAETPQLRLITCGGAFDRTRRSYRDNVVVFAR